MKSLRKNKERLFFVFFFLLHFATEAQIVNIERQRLNADTNGLFGDADLSFRVVKQVNALYSFSQHAQLVYRQDKHQLFLVQNLLLIKTPGENFANSGFIHTRYQMPAENRLMFESFIQVQFNKLLRVQYRQLIAAGGRFELFPREDINRAFIGAALMNEFEIVQNREEVNLDMRMNYYLALRLKLLERMEVNSTTYYKPKVAYSKDFRLSTENSILFDISSTLQFKFELSLFYDEVPPPGVTKNTYSIQNGLRYKF